MPIGRRCGGRRATVIEDRASRIDAHSTALTSAPGALIIRLAVQIRAARRTSFPRAHQREHGGHPHERDQAEGRSGTRIATFSFHTCAVVL
ncbi:MAG: hypothetical protein AAF501_17650 [Pseudomonadota bacterium]